MRPFGGRTGPVFHVNHGRHGTRPAPPPSTRLRRGPSCRTGKVPAPPPSVPRCAAPRATRVERRRSGSPTSSLPSVARRSDRRRVPDSLSQNVGDGLAGGVVHLDGVPVAVDVRHERRGRYSRQFASDKRTRLFAPPSVVAEGVLKVDRALTHASTVLVTSDRRPAAARLPSSVAPHPLMRRSTCLLTVWVPPATSTFTRASPEGSRRSSRAREGQGRARSRRGKGGVHQRSQRYVSADDRADSRDELVFRPMREGLRRSCEDIPTSWRAWWIVCHT